MGHQKCLTLILAACPCTRLRDERLSDGRAQRPDTNEVAEEHGAAEKEEAAAADE